MRLIDADKIPWRREYVSDDNMMTEHVVSKGDVDVMPTIDPVKHGKWEYYVTIGFDEVYTHTACGCFVRRKSLYCPLCGAKMDEVTERH